MALIACPECGKEIAKDADACPHCGSKKVKTQRDQRAIGVGCIGIFVVAFVIAILSTLADVGRSPAPPLAAPTTTPTPAPVVQSLTAESPWIKRVENNIRDRNKEAVKESIDVLEYNHKRGYLSGEDYRTIRHALTVALDGKWAEATRIVGLPPSKAEEAEEQSQTTQQASLPESESSSLKPGERVSSHGIEIPLPEGAKIIDHKPGRPPLSDDVWRVQLNDAERVKKFYVRELTNRGWHPHDLMEECWMKPRAGSSTNEIFCVEVKGQDLFVITLAP